MANKQPNRYTIDLDPNLRKNLESIAKDNRVKLAVVVRWALDDYVLRQSSFDGTKLRDELNDKTVQRTPSNNTALAAQNS